MDQDFGYRNENLTNLNSITVNRNPISNNELTSRKYVDDSIGKRSILRFKQILQICLLLSVGNEVYKLTKMIENRKKRYNNN